MPFNYTEIIIKELSGNASEEEISHLRVWLEESAENKKVYDETKDLWRHLGKIKNEFNPNVDEAWEKFQLKKDHTKRAIPVTYKIAAGILLFAMLGLVTKYVLFSDEERQAPMLEHAVILDTISKNSPITKSIEEKPILKRWVAETKADEQETYLPDQSIVLLSKHTQLTYILDSTTNEQLRKVSLDGEAYFKVVHTGQSFIVRSKFISVKVVGTSFVVKADDADQSPEVSVEEGLVVVFANAKPSISTRLKKGEACTFNVKTSKFELHKIKKKSRWSSFWNRLSRLIKSEKKK